MNIKKIALTSATVVSGIVLAGAVAFAQSALQPMNLSINNSGSVYLTGTVSAVSGSVISVSSWGGTWQINSANATFSPSASSLATIAVGDTVKVDGTISTGMSITATKVKDMTVPLSKRINGTISNLNATAGTFTLATAKMGNVSVATNSSTHVFLNGNTSTLASLTNGVSATVTGAYNAANNSIVASVVTSPSVTDDDDNDKNDNGSRGWGWLKNIFNLGIKFPKNK